MSRKVFDVLTSTGGLIGPEITPAMIPYMEKYSGQQMTTGAQARPTPTTSSPSTSPRCPTAASTRRSVPRPSLIRRTQSWRRSKATSFQGTTLRGLLLEAYAFSKIGQIMLWGAIASFVFAAMMLLLVGLGFQHARSTAPDERMLANPRAVPVA